MAEAAVFDLTVELINGVKLGIEHVEGDEEVAYLIVLDLLILRICFIKWS
jgi:hypothetical protein